MKSGLANIPLPVLTRIGAPATVLGLLLSLGMAIANPAMAQDAPDGARTFNVRCAACHAVREGAPSGMGPNLHGVVGRRAGSLPGFAYSPALKADARKWDAAKLDLFLTNPQKAVPGTRMPIAIMDPALRAAIVAYLGTLQ